MNDFQSAVGLLGGAAAVIALGLLFFLLGAVAGCVTTLIGLWRRCPSWARSLIRASLSQNFGQKRNSTGGDSPPDGGENMPLTEAPASSGSLNSSAEALHTSTFSQTGKSTSNGLQKAGGIASAEDQKRICAQEPESNGFGAATAAQSRTLRNMPPKPNKKPCLACAALRAKFLRSFRVAGGA